jgi:catechol 2,3-dioxygenase-like lactoylglutathione lyase family enzyme
MLNYAIPILASLNEEETIEFYTKKLGFTFHNSWDGYLIFSRDGVNIHLWPADDKKIAENTGCYVNVTGVDQLYSEYLPHGVVHPDGPLKQMDWGMKQFSVLDNNGNIIHFGESTEEDDD